MKIKYKMELLQLLKESPGIQISVRLSDLMEANRRLIEETIEAAPARSSTVPESGTPDSLITSKEAEELLRISNTTLWRRVQEGLLTPVKIGNLTRFRLCDIRKLMEG